MRQKTLLSLPDWSKRHQHLETKEFSFFESHACRDDRTIRLTTISKSQTPYPAPSHSNAAESEAVRKILRISPTTQTGNVPENASEHHEFALPSII
jgi:hypothetical protein